MRIAVTIPVVTALAVGVWFALLREPPRMNAPVFPLPEPHAASYGDDWGADRPQGHHEGTDLYAPAGTPVRSITDGTVTLAAGSNRDGWNRLGGYTVMVRASGKTGPVERADLLYYAHLRKPGVVEPGESVEAGQKIGEVGSTGGGPPGTRGRFATHLHLGWYGGASRLIGDGDPGEAMNPYPLLRWLQNRERPANRADSA